MLHIINNCINIVNDEEKRNGNIFSLLRQYKITTYPEKIQRLVSKKNGGCQKIPWG